MDDVSLGPYASMFWENVPREYLRKILRYLIDAYPDSRKRAKSEFASPIVRWHAPNLRRALVEKQLHEIAAAFPAVEVNYHDDPGSPFWSHTVAVCGGRVVLTASRVTDPDFVIKPSLFRKQCSIGNDQKFLDFAAGEAAAQRSRANNQLYGILLHGSDIASRSKLGFAVVRFPHPDVSEYYGERVDLLKEFPAEAALLLAMPYEIADNDEEIVGDLPDIDLTERGDVG